MKKLGVFYPKEMKEGQDEVGHDGVIPFVILLYAGFRKLSLILGRSWKILVNLTLISAMLGKVA